MRAWLPVAGILLLALQGTGVGAQQVLSPMQVGQLVREVVYNELQDHQAHGFWRYWVESRTPAGTLLNEQVETTDGPIFRLEKMNGRPLDLDARQKESDRLKELLDSPRQRSLLQQEHGANERRIGEIVALLPDAFLYQYAGQENGCARLTFRPNPAYPAHSIQQRVFHAMTGTLWINLRYKRMARLDGHLADNLNFGFGLLGQIYKGGWFQLQRVQVSPTEWKTSRLEIHITGRALLIKSFARETSEVRGGFCPLPADLTLLQGFALLGQGTNGSLVASTNRTFTP